jgi:hypothetical protein
MNKVRAAVVWAVVVVALAGCAKSESSPTAVPAADSPAVQGPGQPPMPRSEATAGPAAPPELGGNNAPVPAPDTAKEYVSGDVTVTEQDGASPAKKPSPTAAAKASSALAPDTIRRVVRNANSKFLACYQAGLQKNPTLAGRVTVKFTIDKNGAPKAVTVAGGDLSDKSVGQCLTKAVSSLTFPQPDRGEVVVSYPFAFSPADAQGGSAAPMK